MVERATVLTWYTRKGIVGSNPTLSAFMEGSPNGMVPLLKSGGRKPLEVRLLYPPPIRIFQVERGCLAAEPRGFLTTTPVAFGGEMRSSYL